MSTDAAEDGSLGIVVLRAAGEETVRVVVYGRTKQPVMTSNITLNLDVSIQQGLVSDDEYMHSSYVYM